MQAVFPYLTIDEAFLVATISRAWRTAARAYPWHDRTMRCVDRLDLVLRRFPRITYLHATLCALSRLPRALCTGTVQSIKLWGQDDWFVTSHVRKLVALGVTHLTLYDTCIAALVPPHIDVHTFRVVGMYP